MQTATIAFSIQGVIFRLDKSDSKMLFSPRENAIIVSFTYVYPIKRSGIPLYHESQTLIFHTQSCQISACKEKVCDGIGKDGTMGREISYGRGHPRARCEAPSRSTGEEDEAPELFTIFYTVLRTQKICFSYC